MSAIFIFSLVAKSNLHVKRLSFGHVGVTIFQYPEFLHCLDIWANSFIKVVFRARLIGKEIVQLEVFFCARHHWSSKNGLFAIFSLPNFDLDPEILVKFF